MDKKRLELRLLRPRDQDKFKAKELRSKFKHMREWGFIYADCNDHWCWGLKTNRDTRQ